MRRVWIVLGVSFLALAPLAGHALPSSVPAQQVVDRVVAKVDDDILLLSDLRELGEFQDLLEGKAEPANKRLDELIDQWIATREAMAGQFAQPSDADVKAAHAQLTKELGGEQAFAARQTQAGLTAAAVDRQLRRELFVSRYLDYKFRPASQVDADAIQKYYNEQFSAQLKAQGQAVPPLDSVRGEIRELLVQQEISEHATQWLAESRSRLKVEEFLPAANQTNQ